MRVLLYAKMLKETKTEETIVFFVTFLSLVAFQLGGGARDPWAPPLATPMIGGSFFCISQRCRMGRVKKAFRKFLLKKIYCETVVK